MTPELLADIVNTLVDLEIKEVEENQRVYVSPDIYGKSLYHLIDKKEDALGDLQVCYTILLHFTCPGVSRTGALPFYAA